MGPDGSSTLCSSVGASLGPCGIGASRAMSHSGGSSALGSSVGTSRGSCGTPFSSCAKVAVSCEGVGVTVEFDGWD